MSFSITSAREAAQTGSIQIKKGEGITHALMRFADTENASKGVKELEKAFRTLTAQQRTEIMTLAKEVGNITPFVGRVKNKVYSITDRTNIGEKLHIVIKNAKGAAVSVVAAASIATAVPTVAAPASNPPLAAASAAPGKPQVPAVKQSAPEADAAATAARSVREKPLDWTDEMRHIRCIETALKDGTAGDSFSSTAGSAYRYKKASNTEIEYAKVIQSDDDSYYFDKPENAARMVYKYDNRAEKLIGSLSVDANGNITLKKGKKFEAPYMPTPKISKQ